MLPRFRTWQWDINGYSLSCKQAMSKRIEHDMKLYDMIWNSASNGQSTQFRRTKPRFTQNNIPANTSLQLQTCSEIVIGVVFWGLNSTPKIFGALGYRKVMKTQRKTTRSACKALRCWRHSWTLLRSPDHDALIWLYIYIYIHEQKIYPFTSHDWVLS